MRFLLFLLPLGAAAQVLNVTILDYAAVPPQTLAAASQVLSEIYRKAGGRLETTVDGREWRRGEITFLSQVPGDIVLRICSKQMAKTQVRRAMEFGFVQPYPDGEVPRVASVFYHQVENLQHAVKSSTPEVLGSILAHEMGHLLLGRGAHSPRGIMSPRWDVEELSQVHRGQFVFDRRQSESIVREIQKRNSGQTASAGIVRQTQ